jgi:flavin reductase (DIM6/NTAB) family NADH-FMN oxidoreductase RutF
MGRFATGVAVITGRSASGEFLGFTANSLTSVSLEPPLVLICVDRDSASRDSLVKSGRFAVSLLRRDQEPLARRFAGEARETRFQDLALHFPPGGVPVLQDALAWLDCRVWRLVEAGDHTVLFGLVEAAGDVTGGGRETGAGDGPPKPLVYFRKSYGTVAP